MQQRNLSLLFLFLLFSVPYKGLLAQQQQPPLIAGFQFRPIIPSGLFRTGPQKSTVGSTQFIVSQKFSYNLGMVLQGRVWRNLLFETGICLTQRNYNLEIKEGNFDNNSPFTILGYEIPITALASIPLSETSWFNNSLGVVFDIFPSDEATSSPDFTEYALRVHEFSPALVANTGFRFMVKNAGSFFIGATYHLPFARIYDTQLVNLHDPNQPVLYSTISGTYFAIDLKYFFYNNSTKK